MRILMLLFNPLPKAINQANQIKKRSRSPSPEFVPANDNREQISKSNESQNPSLSPKIRQKTAKRQRLVDEKKRCKTSVNF